MGPLKAIAIVPVKRFVAAKQRLATTGVEDERRRAIVAAMLGDVLEALGQSRTIEGVVVVSGEPEVARIAAGFGADLVEDPDDAGHPQAAERGIEHALGLGADCVALLPGDCPLISARELDRALTGLPERYVAVIPDRHGEGTNGLILRPPRVIKPAFGEGSRARHEGLAREAGVAHAVEPLPSLGLDLDTPADIVALTTAIESGRGAAPRTAKALGI